MVACGTHAADAGGTVCTDPPFSEEVTLPPAEEVPSTSSDVLVDEPDIEFDTLYDPFDRPEGEVIVQAFSPSRSRSPRRA